jgi:hypothetical protein
MNSFRLLHSDFCLSPKEPIVNRSSDEDIQLLEAYLDDELSADEIDALRERLIEEPLLAASLANLRRDRSTRQQVFAMMEPGELAVSDTVIAVQKRVRNRMRWGGRMRESMRYVAAAACVTLGVLIGAQATRQTPVTSPLAPVSGQTVASNDGKNGDLFPRPFSDDPGPATPVQFTGSLRPMLPAGTPRMVVLCDALGNPVSVQQFETAEQAREFVQDLYRAAAASGRRIVPFNPNAPVPSVTPSLPPNYVPAPAGNDRSQIVPVSDEQF